MAMLTFPESCSRIHCSSCVISPMAREPSQLFCSLNPSITKKVLRNWVNNDASIDRKRSTQKGLLGIGVGKFNFSLIVSFSDGLNGRDLQREAS